MNAKKAKQQRREERQRLTAEGQRSVFTHPAEDFTGTNPVFNGTVEQTLLGIATGCSADTEVVVGMNMDGDYFSSVVAYCFGNFGDEDLVNERLSPVNEETQILGLWAVKQFFGETDPRVLSGTLILKMGLKDWLLDVAFFAHFIAGRELTRFPGEYGEGLISLPRWDGMPEVAVLRWDGGVSSEEEMKEMVFRIGAQHLQQHFQRGTTA